MADGRVPAAHLRRSPRVVVRGAPGMDPPPHRADRGGPGGLPHGDRRDAPGGGRGVREPGVPPGFRGPSALRGRGRRPTGESLGAPLAPLRSPLPRGGERPPHRPLGPAHPGPDPPGLFHPIRDPLRRRPGGAQRPLRGRARLGAGHDAHRLRGWPPGHPAGDRPPPPRRPGVPAGRVLSRGSGGDPARGVDPGRMGAPDRLRRALRPGDGAPPRPGRPLPARGLASRRGLVPAGPVATRAPPGGGPAGAPGTGAGPEPLPPAPGRRLPGRLGGRRRVRGRPGRSRGVGSLPPGVGRHGGPRGASRGRPGSGDRPGAERRIRLRARGPGDRRVPGVADPPGAPPGLPGPGPGRRLRPPLSAQGGRAPREPGGGPAPGAPGDPGDRRRRLHGGVGALRDASR